MKRWRHRTAYKEDGAWHMCPIYLIWVTMKDRCTNLKLSTMCPEWQSYDVWRDWAEVQVGYSSVCASGRLYELDKDLIGDRRHYSPETCCFLPRAINAFLSVRRIHGGRLPIGVTMMPDGRCSPYRARINGKLLGYFKTAEEARARYTLCKNQQAKDLAEKYRSTISEPAYLKLISYQVEKYYD